MKRTLRFFAVILFLLAVIGVFNTPLTQSKVAVADGMPMPTNPDKLPPMTSSN